MRVVKVLITQAVVRGDDGRWRVADSFLCERTNAEEPPTYDPQTQTLRMPKGTILRAAEREEGLRFQWFDPVGPHGLSHPWP